VFTERCFPAARSERRDLGRGGGFGPAYLRALFFRPLVVGLLLFFLVLYTCLRVGVWGRLAFALVGGSKWEC
jgi:hypothetical protein